MRAFVVVSPESSGNHLISELLESVGCPLHNFRSVDPEKYLNNMVTAVSIPSSDQWYHIEQDIIVPLKVRGYTDIKIIISFRSWDYMIQSQIRNGHRQSWSEALGIAQKSFRHIFTTIGNNEFTLVMFDRLVSTVGYKEKLLLELGLPIETNYKIWNSNARYATMETAV